MVKLQSWSFEECRVPLSLPSLPGSLWPGLVAPDRVLSMGQIELFDIQTVQTNDLCLIELFEVELFDHLTMCKQMTDV